LGEDGAYAITLFHTRDVSAHFNHFTNAIGKRHERQRLLGVVEPPNGQEVTEVEGHRAHPDDDLIALRNGIGQLDLRERIETKCTLNDDGFHERVPFWGGVSCTWHGARQCS
jgi:hypothetical protein